MIINNYFEIFFPQTVLILLLVRYRYHGVFVGSSRNYFRFIYSKDDIESTSSEHGRDFMKTSNLTMTLIGVMIAITLLVLTIPIVLGK